MTHYNDAQIDRSMLPITTRALLWARDIVPPGTKLAMDIEERLNGDACYELACKRAERDAERRTVMLDDLDHELNQRFGSTGPEASPTLTIEMFEIPDSQIKEAMQYVRGNHEDVMAAHFSRTVEHDPSLSALDHVYMEMHDWHDCVRTREVEVLIPHDPTLTVDDIFEAEVASWRAYDRTTTVGVAA